MGGKAVTTGRSLPPLSVAVSNAEVAIRKADAIGATQYAPLALHVARQKLEAARRAIEAASADDSSDDNTAGQARISMDGSAA